VLMSRLFDANNLPFSEEWEDFKTKITLLTQNVTDQQEQDFRLRQLCQQCGIPIKLGRQIQVQISRGEPKFEPIWVEDFLSQGKTSKSNGGEA